MNPLTPTSRPALWTFLVDKSGHFSFRRLCFGLGFLCSLVVAILHGLGVTHGDATIIEYIFVTSATGLGSVAIDQFGGGAKKEAKPLAAE